MDEHLEQATNAMLRAMSEGCSALEVVGRAMKGRPLPAEVRIGSEPGGESALMRSQLRAISGDDGDGFNLKNAARHV